MAGRHLGRDMALVHRLVGEHGLAHDVADGVDVRHVGAHLDVDGDVAALADHHARFLRADALAVRRAAHRLQNQVVRLRLLRRGLALEAHHDAGGCGLGAHRLRLQHDVVEARRVELLPDLHQVAVGAEHQSVEHLDHVEPRAEGGVHRAHLEADDAAAHDEHALRARAHLERAGGGDDARIVLRQERQLHRLGAGRDDGVGEAHRLRLAVGQRDLQVVRVHELAAAGEHGHLAHLGHHPEAAGELADHLVLVGAQLVEVDRGRAIADAVGAEVLHLVHHRGHVQQRLRRDAPDVEAHPAQRGIALDEHRLHAEVGGAEGRRVAAGAGAEDQHVALEVGRAGKRGGHGCRLAPSPARGRELG